MGTHFPQEILRLIATHLQDSEASLVPCIRVCREWQVACEPFIYSQPIHLLSAGGVNKDDLRGQCR
jgi:hypothetical protein